MITTRDIKVFIFSILFSTLCYALFDQPIKEAEAQGGMPPMGAPGMPPMGAPGMAPPGGDTYDLLQAHITGAVANHNLTRDLIEAHIKGAIANHTLTQDRIEAHINGAVAKHAEMLEKLDALLAHLGAK
jgi:hypothetical protein